MNKEIHFIANTRKTAESELENNDFDFLQALYSVYKNFHNF